MTSTRIRSALAAAAIAALVLSAILAVAHAPGASAVSREPAKTSTVVSRPAP